MGFFAGDHGGGTRSFSERGSTSHALEFNAATFLPRCALPATTITGTTVHHVAAEKLSSREKYLPHWSPNRSMAPPIMTIIGAFQTVVETYISPATKKLDSSDPDLAKVRDRQCFHTDDPANYRAQNAE
jgi:hypothetical protein